MTGSRLPYEELEKLSARILEITQLLEEKELRWLELSEHA
jgi:ATP-binding cassette subfamily F protein uup